MNSRLAAIVVVCLHGYIKTLGQKLSNPIRKAQSFTSAAGTRPLLL